LLTRAAENEDPLNFINRTLDAFVVDTTGEDVATVLVDELRSAGIACDRAYDGRSMKSQMKVADKSGARWALLVGPQELLAGEVTIRDLRSDNFEQAQQKASRDDLVAAIANLLTK
jgi:histidyl-tRNA synthetase